MTDPTVPPNRDNDRARMTPRTDRYAALPDKTRMFIEDLHDDDLNNLNGILKLTREKGLSRIIWMVEIAEAASLLGKYSKWLAVFTVAVFSGVASMVTGWNLLKEHIPWGR